MMLMVLVLCGCHSKKEAVHQPPSKRRVEKVSDDWKTLNIRLTSRDNKQLYREIKGWLGAPYLYGGNTKKGVDCSASSLGVMPCRLPSSKMPSSSSCGTVYSRAKAAKPFFTAFPSGT